MAPLRGGCTNPASNASPATTASEVPSGTSASATSGTADATAQGSSTARWPRRSTSRATNGDRQARPRAKEPAATPPSA